MICLIALAHRAILCPDEEGSKEKGIASRPQASLDFVLVPLRSKAARTNQKAILIDRTPTRRAAPSVIGMIKRCNLHDLKRVILSPMEVLAYDASPGTPRHSKCVFFADA
jgi:hypothetical protein